MSHAARTHDVFARLEEIQERIARHSQAAAEIADKLNREKAEAERDADLALLLADVASIMRDVDTRNFSEGKRVRFNAVRARVMAKVAA